jgi:hypothetical protein
VPDAAREPHVAHGPLSIEAVREATRQALARRHAQRAHPTFGDEADAAILAALRGVAPHDLAAGRAVLLEAGESLGRQVYARRCYEDGFAGAIAILSTTLLASGWGSVSVERWFHRQGVVAFSPGPAASPAPLAFSTYLSGALAGYLSEAFNCRAAITATDERRYEVRLLEGRDVNQGRQAA